VPPVKFPPLFCIETEVTVAELFHTPPTTNAWWSVPPPPEFPDAADVITLFPLAFPPVSMTYPEALDDPEPEQFATLNKV